MAMRVGGIWFDDPVRGCVLASREVKVRLSELLRQWTEPRRPAILFVLVGESPFVGVYAEDHLLDTFPGARLVPAEPVFGASPGTLLVFVADKMGTTIFVLADPRARTVHANARSSPASSPGHFEQQTR